MKKILSFALALLIVGGSMIACNKTPDTPETPDETPGTEQPGTEDPGTDVPGTEDPGTDVPGTDVPGTEDPGTDVPGTEDPGTDVPEQPEEIEFVEVSEMVKAMVTVELRRAPAADAANVVDVLRINQIVARVAVSTNGEWSKIYYEAEGLTGYYYVPSVCLAVYVEPGQPGADPSDFVEISPAEIVYVTTNDLNLRTQPSKNGAVVARLAFGTKLERIGKNAAGWSKVLVNGNEYYVSSDYLTAEDVTGASFDLLETPEVKTVTADTLKIRTSPWMDDLDENVAGYLRKGDAVKCVAKSPDGYWYRIELDEGKFYYVGALYLSGYVPGTVIPGTPENPDTPGEEEPTRPVVTFTTLTEPLLMYAINKTGGVRVYGEPDNLTATVKTLTVGAAVRCVAVSTDGTWYKVTFPEAPSVSFYIQATDLESSGK